MSTFSRWQVVRHGSGFVSSQGKLFIFNFEIKKPSLKATFGVRGTQKAANDGASGGSPASMEKAEASVREVEVSTSGRWTRCSPCRHVTSSPCSGCGLQLASSRLLQCHFESIVSDETRFVVFVRCLRVFGWLEAFRFGS